MSNTNAPINIPVKHSSDNPGDTPETQGQDETTRQESEFNAVLADQEQQIVARELRAQKLQEVQSKDQVRATKAIYTGPRPPPPKKIGIFSFAGMLALGVMKDLIDFVDWGILGTVLNIVPIMGILLIVVITGGSLMEFMNKKKYILGSGAALEFLPIIAFLPIWTLSIFWLYIESRRGKPVSGKVATRFGRRVAKGRGVQGAVKRLGLKKG